MITGGIIACAMLGACVYALYHYVRRRLDRVDAAIDALDLQAAVSERNATALCGGINALAEAIGDGCGCGERVDGEVVWRDGAWHPVDGAGPN